MQNIKLFVFDIDNTITHGQTIWEIMHRECATWESHGLPYWQQYRAGEIDFDKFARLDAGAWANCHRDLLTNALQKIELTPGFAELIEMLQQKEIKIAFISSSIGQLADKLMADFKINTALVFANYLELKDGRLTGEIDIKVTGQGKQAILLQLKKELGLVDAQIAVAGDSHYDLPMMQHAEHSFIVRNVQHRDEAKYFVNDFFEVLNLF